jgi:hypothetical protein
LKNLKNERKEREKAKMKNKVANMSLETKLLLALDRFRCPIYGCYNYPSSLEDFCRNCNLPLFCHVHDTNKNRQEHQKYFCSKKNNKERLN